jgi:hypothetical protein
LHDEFLEAIARTAQLRVQLRPYTKSWRDWKKPINQTRSRTGEPNWEIIRRMSKCSVVMMFLLYMKQFGGLADGNVDWGWKAIAFWFLNLIHEHGCSAKEVYLELQAERSTRYVDGRFINLPNPFEMLAGASHLESVLKQNSMKRETVYEKNRNRFAARWEKCRPEWLCHGEAEPEYFRFDSKLFWTHVLKKNQTISSPVHTMDRGSGKLPDQTGSETDMNMMVAYAIISMLTEYGIITSRHPLGQTRKPENGLLAKVMTTSNLQSNPLFN